LEGLGKTLKKLSAGQPNKIIYETRAEQTRHKNIDAATMEILPILKKYKIDFQDIDLSIFNKNGGKSSAKKRGNLDRAWPDTGMVSGHFPELRH
jgi:hypothetical protein